MKEKVWCIGTAKDIFEYMYNFNLVAEEIGISPIHILFEELGKDGIETNTWAVFSNFKQFQNYFKGDEAGATYVDEIKHKLRDVAIIKAQIENSFCFEEPTFHKTCKFTYRMSFVKDDLDVFLRLMKDGYDCEDNKFLLKGLGESLILNTPTKRKEESRK